MFSASQLQGGSPPIVMTVAGSDSSGGAGIQADIKTFTSLGCYGTSVITAMTAQNTMGVQSVHPSPPEFVKQQIHSVLNDMKIDAIKTGMLFDANNVRAVVASLKAHYDGADDSMPPLVCDPVCISTSGHTLLQPDAIQVMIDELFPLASLITPNRAEADLLVSHTKHHLEDGGVDKMIDAARILHALGPKAVLVKGGGIIVMMDEIKSLCDRQPHIELVLDGLLGENMEIIQNSEQEPPEPMKLVVDVLYQSDGSITLFVGPHLNSNSTHGTGCTLSAALICALAKGHSIKDATKLAEAYTHAGIETAFPLGNGHGPLNHMHSIVPRNIPKPTPSNPHPFTRILIQSTAKIWKAYVQHDFVTQLGQGVLPKQCFLHFIKQDYHYLKYYGRAYALLGAKSPSFSGIESSAQIMLNVVREVGMHISFCAEWGISEDELNTTPESPACTAYGAYLIDIGLQGDRTKLIMALAACLLGYGEVGLWLRKEASKPNSWVIWDENPYLKWMEDYSGESYQKAVKIGINLIEASAAADPPSKTRFDEWVGVWERCTLLEKGFWDMSMGLL